MTNQTLNTVPGKLNEIMEAKAKIAMPEIVSVFISKYETELYERKNDLSAEIVDTKKDLNLLEKSALQKADFSSYDGIKVPKLGLISYISEDIHVNWATGEFVNSVGLRTDEIKGDRTGFNKSITQTIPKSFIKQYEGFTTTISQLQADLQDTVAKISDMSRKERQVKARISELRLQEQGLEDFLGDAEIQKLIKID